MCIIHCILKLNSIYCLLKLTKSYAIDYAHTLIGQQGAFQNNVNLCYFFLAIKCTCHASSLKKFWVQKM